MTFLEKAKKEHRISNENHTIQDLCPSDLGYEQKVKCKAIIGAEENEKDYICRRCWEREMPNTELEKVKEAFSKVGKAISKASEDVYKEDMNTAYNKGLNDGRNEVWEFMKKMYLETDCLDIRKIYELENYNGTEFGTVLKSYTPQEALAKLKAYEEAQKIKVGDVVTNEERNVEILVTEIDDYERTFNGIKATPTDELGNQGGVYTMMLMCKFKKTGKHIDIKSILEQIGE